MVMACDETGYLSIIDVINNTVLTTLNLKMRVECMAVADVSPVGYDILTSNSDVVVVRDG